MRLGRLGANQIQRFIDAYAIAALTPAVPFKVTSMPVAEPAPATSGTPRSVSGVTVRVNRSLKYAT